MLSFTVTLWFVKKQQALNFLTFIFILFLTSAISNLPSLPPFPWRLSRQLCNWQYSELFLKGLTEPFFSCVCQEFKSYEHLWENPPLLKKMTKMFHPPVIKQLPILCLFSCRNPTSSLDSRELAERKHGNQYLKNKCLRIIGLFF